MLQNDKNKIHTEIKLRALFAISDILEKKLVKSKRAFCLEVGYAVQNLYRLEKDENSYMPMNIIAHLVRKYKVNANWIFAAEGDMYRNDETVYVGNDIITLEQVNNDIKARFIPFTETLRMKGKISSFRSFYLAAGLDKDMHSKIQQTEDYRFVQGAAIKHAVENYDLNANWLILGIGNQTGS
ncbi:hypothetical protein [Dysgonomonas massiliensis]|uniref:hypothetical protein n=1 Tax=Dysgonomonas massiliensis TaxID=2040292 RepID=UPI000C785584|nr:hypothetical protein [Dysgonomonas massiliensis]